MSLVELKTVTGDEIMSSDNLVTVIRRFFDEYTSTTPQKLKLVDAYLAYIMLTGIVQFVYCLLVGTFPFNSFLSGFISCVGSFILAGKTGNSLNLISVVVCVCVCVCVCYTSTIYGVCVCVCEILNRETYKLCLILLHVCRHCHDIYMTV